LTHVKEIVFGKSERPAQNGLATTARPQAPLAGDWSAFSVEPPSVRFISESMTFPKQIDEIEITFFWWSE
jgi:hypothetical protein